MAKPHKGPAPSPPTPPTAAAPAKPPAPPAAPDAPQRTGGKPLSYVQKVFIAVGISTAAILFSAFIFYIAHVLVLVFAGLLLAVFLSAPSDLLAQHTGMKRVYALLIVLAALTLIVIGSGAYMGRTVIIQSKQMGPALEGAFRKVKTDLEQKIATPSTTPAPKPSVIITPDPAPEAAPDAAIAPPTAPTTTTSPPPDSASTDEKHVPHWLAAKFLEISEAGTEFLFSEKFVRGAGSVAGGVVSSTFGIIGESVIVFGVGLFFAINPRLYSQGVVKLMPLSQRPRTAKILSEVGTQLEWWFVGQLCSMASIGLLTFIGLKILGIPMAATLAILAGLLNFIPNFGPIIAAVPAVLIAVAPAEGSTMLRPDLAGWTILMYIIIQLLEGWVITPFFQQRAVEIPPALIILAQVIFAMLLGPVGLVLATPILAAVLVIVRMVYLEDLLGDKPEKLKAKA